MTKPKIKHDAWEGAFGVVLIITTIFTLGATLFIYSLIKYAVKAAIREVENAK